ncbi:MAG: glycosyltransferase family 10, partial [Candidatus Poribacteria bacterium]|nr:glycosyltransferase family 10 [Candidatus Poribacteria bacterium]
MARINIVYQHLSPRTGYALRKGGVDIVWSSLPTPNCDLYAYASSLSYTAPQDAPQVLIQWEPVFVLPGDYTDEIWAHFDYILTMVNPLLELSPKFHRFLHPAYHLGMPPEPLPDIASLPDTYPTDGRDNAICMILGNKNSIVPGELYSIRPKIARWFHDHSPIRFDAYGKPPFDLPNSKGSAPKGETRATMSRYRYCLCFENGYDPFWSDGFMTERIFHSIETRTVPIYYGNSTIETVVSPDCFIDYRKFDGFADLNDYLVGMTDDEYRGYIDAMDRWVLDGNLEKRSMYDTYDQLVGICCETSPDTPEQLFGDATTWELVAVPDDARLIPLNENDDVELPPDGSFRCYWTWEYLGSVPLERCEQAVGRAARASFRTASSEQIKRVLYVGISHLNGAAEGLADYSVYNYLAALSSYDELTISTFDSSAMFRRHGVAGMSERLR